MTDPYYCKIYVDTDEEKDQLQKVLIELSGVSFRNVDVEVPVYRNEDFEPVFRKKIPYRPIFCSKYYAEIGTIENRPELIEGFQMGAARLTRLLRDGGRLVTVSCEFEDLIIRETGWNWTLENSEPPGRSL